MTMFRAASADFHAMTETLGRTGIVPTARGTTALWAVLRVLHPGGTHVMVPANVCEVVVAGIRLAGSEPRFVDVDPVEGIVTPQALDEAWDRDCGCVLVVHLFGTPAPVDLIAAWAGGRKMTVVEDCCHALGTRIHGRPAGTFGDAAIHSFGPGKNVDLGIGGLIATDDTNLADACRELIDLLPTWGAEHELRDARCQGLLRAFRLDVDRATPQRRRHQLLDRFAPALIVGPPDGWTERLIESVESWEGRHAARSHSASAYRQRLTHPLVRHRRDTPDATCWRYTFHVPPPLRDMLVEALRRRRIPASHWFPRVDAWLGMTQGPMPGADRFAASVVNLFVEPQVGAEVVERGAAMVNETLAQLAPALLEVAV